MNAFGDDYVSFTAMDLSLSPDGQYLLVSTGMITIQTAIAFNIYCNKQQAFNLCIYHDLSISDLSKDLGLFFEMLLITLNYTFYKSLGH